MGQVKEEPKLFQTRTREGVIVYEGLRLESALLNAKYIPSPSEVVRVHADGKLEVLFTS
jgi:hypothetical protein